MESPGSPDDNRKDAYGWGQYLHLGMEFAIAIAIGVGGGYWLDKKLDTLPLFLIIGLALGMTSGLISIYRATYSPKNDESGKR